MNRMWRLCAIALPLVMLTAGPALADVKTRDKTQVKFEGMLGRMMGMFGGKAAKDGVVTASRRQGRPQGRAERHATGRIVDLKEEKVYELDVKKKTYEVITFEELRRRMREAREKAEKEGAERGARPPGAGQAGARDGRRLRRQGDRPDAGDRRLQHAGSRHDGDGARKGQGARGGRRPGHDVELVDGRRRFRR